MSLKDFYKDQVIEFKWLDKEEEKTGSMKLSDMDKYHCFYSFDNAKGEFIVIDGEPFIKWLDNEETHALTQDYVDRIGRLELIPNLTEEFKEIYNNLKSITPLQSSEKSNVREEIDKIKESLRILNNIVSWNSF